MGKEPKDFYFEKEFAFCLKSGRPIAFKDFRTDLLLVSSSKNSLPKEMRAIDFTKITFDGKITYPLIISETKNRTLRKVSPRKVTAETKTGDILWEIYFPKNRKVKRKFVVCSSGMVCLDNFGNFQLYSESSGEMIFETYVGDEQYAGVATPEVFYPFLKELGDLILLGVDTYGYRSFLFFIDLQKKLISQKAELPFRLKSLAGGDSTFVVTERNVLKLEPENRGLFQALLKKKSIAWKVSETDMRIDCDLYASPDNLIYVHANGSIYDAPMIAVVDRKTSMTRWQYIHQFESPYSIENSTRKSSNTPNKSFVFTRSCGIREVKINEFQIAYLYMEKGEWQLYDDDMYRK